MKIENDRQLSPHFSLYSLTRTDHIDLQEENRNVTADEELKLIALANLLESVRVVLGCDLDVHSCRRYLELNKRVGGSDRSQHLKCEAADCSPAGPDSEYSVTDAWQKIATAARQGRISFGQRIIESDSKGRESGRKWWIHISLGVPYRSADRCGEVATKTNGKFVLISRIA